MIIEDIRLIGLLIFGAMLSAFIAGVSLLSIAVYKVRHLDIPKNASFSETLHLTPLVVVLAVDLLDMALDFLAAPLSWAILDWLGLKALRGVATVEALIPGTQLIPTLTLCWVGVRIIGNRQPSFVQNQSFMGLERISTRS
jgi:hypothetical protein